LHLSSEKNSLRGQGYKGSRGRRFFAGFYVMEVIEDNLSILMIF